MEQRYENHAGQKILGKTPLDQWELWHGSPEVVMKPEFGRGKRNNDYGRGFYCTENKNLAMEWACPFPGRDGFANRYFFNPAGLRILDLNGQNFSTLNWLALLMDNRKVDFPFSVSTDGIEYLRRTFLPDIHGYDVIRGYRADDAYFSFVRAFMSNTISLGQLAEAMKLGKLGEQIVLKSRESFARIQFVEYDRAPSEVFYRKRSERAAKAREDFREITTHMDVNGIYIRDILREQMQSDDPRLQ